jgi:hypothetical protein
MHPLLPVTVRVELPPGVLVVVVTARVDEPAAGLGLKLPAAPEGSPLMPRSIKPLNPPMFAT